MIPMKQKHDIPFGRLRIITVITLMTLIAFFSAVFSFAASSSDSIEENLAVYNTHIITGNKEATYIDGEVLNAEGQEIKVSAGLSTIATKRLPDHGGSASFRIKVPAKYISTKRVNVFHVQMRNADSVRVEIAFRQKEEQDISFESEKVSLTIPGNEETLKAAASSGEPLIYRSEDPKVATVDEDGTIVPVGEGSTRISVKQIGSSKYDEAEASVDVSVEEIDAFSVTFHSSAKTDETSRQIIKTGEPTDLDENTFENGEHEFLGWASEDGGLVEYRDSEEVSELAEKGENKDLYAVWTGDGIPAAIAWAVDIANDDSFTYGKKPETSNIGCYFCGTNQTHKPKGYEKTYVCMTFITAAYAHGAEDPEMLALCRGGRYCLSLTESNFKFDCWEKVGSAKSLSVSDLQPGDVICSYAADNKSGHLSMYIGDGNIVEATSAYGDLWGPKSIGVRYGNAGRMLSHAARKSSKSYVMRYVGNGSPD